MVVKESSERRSHPRKEAANDSQFFVEHHPVACHACGTWDTRPYLMARGYRIVRCTSCGLLFVNPQPSDISLSDLYASHDQGDQWLVQEEHFNRAIRREIVRFRRYGSVLDIGCGSGNFLRVMRDSGFAAWGVERSEPGWRYATECHGLNVFHGSLEDFLRFDGNQVFDVITLLNVLEHLKDPRGVLVSLARLANPGSLLTVVVPDARLHSVLAKIRQLAGSNDPFWMDSEHQPVIAIDPPYHLTCFEPRTLRLILERSGYRVLKVANAPVIFNPQVWRKVLKLVIAYSGRCVELLSWGRAVIGYSTLAIAQRQ